MALDICLVCEKCYPETRSACVHCASTKSDQIEHVRRAILDLAPWWRRVTVRLWHTFRYWCA